MKMFDFQRTAVCFLCLLTWPLFAERIVVLHPEGKDFSLALAAMRNNLGGDWDVREVVIAKGTDWGTVKEDVLGLQPQALVLMDNQAIKLYKQYVSASSSPALPAIALMALQLDKVSEGMDVLGISYEIPVVTSVVNLRALSDRPLRRVGVVYRKGWETYIGMNKQYCITENVDLVSIPVSESIDSPRELRKALDVLLQDRTIDALWILNDNRLVNKEMILDAWFPSLARSELPVIVGVESLVRTNLGMGSFAVLPDPSGLGEQAAEMLFELQEHQWKALRRIDQPLSVLKIINTTIAKKKGYLVESGLGTVDAEVK